MIRPVSSGNRLAVVTGGRVQVLGERDAEVVRYRIGFGQFFVASLVMLALVAPEVWAHTRIPEARRLGLLAGIWLLLFGGSFSMGVASFRSMLQSAGRYRYADTSAPVASSE